MPPLRLGVIISNAIHQLRAALDGMVWQVVLADGGIPARLRVGYSGRSVAGRCSATRRLSPGLPRPTMRVAPPSGLARRRWFG
jgi:hypothetical protein